MENKLIAIILLAIGSIMVGQYSIIAMIGIWFMFWAYRFWTNKPTAIHVTVPEEEIGPTEMDNRTSPIYDLQFKDGRPVTHQNAMQITEMDNDVSPVER